MKPFFRVQYLKTKNKNSRSRPKSLFGSVKMLIVRFSILKFVACELFVKKKDLKKISQSLAIVFRITERIGQ